MPGQCSLLAAFLTLCQRCLLTPDLGPSLPKWHLAESPSFCALGSALVLAVRQLPLGHSSVGCGCCAAAHLELQSWDVRPLPAPRGTVSPGDILLQASTDRSSDLLSGDLTVQGRNQAAESHIVFISHSGYRPCRACFLQEFKVQAG